MATATFDEFGLPVLALDGEEVQALRALMCKVDIRTVQSAKPIPSERMHADEQVLMAEKLEGIYMALDKLTLAHEDNASPFRPFEQSMGVLVLR